MEGAYHRPAFAGLILRQNILFMYYPFKMVLLVAVEIGKSFALIEEEYDGKNEGKNAAGKNSIPDVGFTHDTVQDKHAWNTENNLAGQGQHGGNGNALTEDHDALGQARILNKQGNHWFD